MTADPAETLRRAAAVLREAAEEAKEATPGRWHKYGGTVAYETGQCNCGTQGGPYGHERDCGLDMLCELGAPGEPNPDAAYIALVDPVVGAKLADWLESEAQAAETWVDVIVESGLDRPGTHALRIARSILRETGGE